MNLFMCHIQQTLTTILRPNRASPSVDVKVNTVRKYGRQNYNSAPGKQCTDLTDAVEITGRVCRSLVKTTIAFMMCRRRVWFTLAIYLGFSRWSFNLARLTKLFMPRLKLWFHESFKCDCLLCRTLFSWGIVSTFFDVSLYPSNASFQAGV